VAIHVVPVIYDHASKQILRWYLLDHVRQLNDSAFKPANNGERVHFISFQLYKALAGNDSSRPLLNKLQDYITGNAP
jgi:hypothetical protein